MSDPMFLLRTVRPNTSPYTSATRYPGRSFMVVTITSDIRSLPLGVAFRRHDATHALARATAVRDGEGEYAAPTSVSAWGTRRRQAAPPTHRCHAGIRRGRRHGAAGSALDGTKTRGGRPSSVRRRNRTMRGP